MVAAHTLISQVSQMVLANVGFSWAFHTGRDAVGEIKPGMAVTSTALTAHTYDCEIPDAANDIAAGVALRNPEHDIDKAYAQWDEFEVGLTGGGHLVWGHLHNETGNKFGSKLAITVAGAGTVTDITEANVIEQFAIKFSETASTAAVQPCLMILIPG